MISSAYTGPTDWGEIEYEWWNPVLEEYQTLTITYSAFERHDGLKLRMDSITCDRKPMSLSADQRNDILNWLYDNYEPTEAL